MYDGATACAEAAAMACRITKRTGIHICGSVHPHYTDVTLTQLQHLGLNIEKSAPSIISIDSLLNKLSDDLACIIVQNPGILGDIVDLEPLANECHSRGVLLVVCVTEPLSLGLIKPPGAMGADIVIGEGQSLSGPLSFGGPGLGLFATRQKYIRQMPGRICGETIDANGQRGFVLTLSTREQHIRREKATSNICTNSGLVALAFSIHMTLLGEIGFTKLAKANHAHAVNLARELSRMDGVHLIPENFFNEFAIMLPVPAAPLVEKLVLKGLLAGIPMSRFYPNIKSLENILIIAITEMNTQQDIDLLTGSLKEVVG
jgi:glycine dehydrogenase subunit 1